MKKVLISGYIGFNNFGDEAIFKALSSHLINLGCNVSVLSNKKYENIKSYKRLSIFSAVLNSDVVISGGGSLLQNKTSNFSLLYYLSIIFLAKLLFKKAIIFAQGIEPINGKFFEYLTRFALRISDFVSTRDNKSTELLKGWKIKVHTLSDPVYSILPEVNKNKEGLIVQLRECCSGIADELAYAIKNNYEGEVAVMAFQDCDKDVCLKFANTLKQFGIKSKYVYNEDVDEVFKLLNGAKYVISTRLHGIMVANALQARVFALSYDDKTDTAVEELELENINLKNPCELNNKLSKFFAMERKNVDYRRFSFEKIDEALSEYF